MSETVEFWLSKLERVRQSGSGWMARCPAHDDGTNSLSIDEGNDGRVLLKCHAGCTHEAIATAVGLTPLDLFPRRNGGGEGTSTPQEIMRTFEHLDKKTRKPRS